MPPAVYDEACRARDVHALVDERLARQPSGRQEQIGKQDQQGSGPAGDLDREFDGAQAASLRRT